MKNICKIEITGYKKNHRTCVCVDGTATMERLRLQSEI